MRLRKVHTQQQQTSTHTKNLQLRGSKKKIVAAINKSPSKALALGGVHGLAFWCLGEAHTHTTASAEDN